MSYDIIINPNGDNKFKSCIPEWIYFMNANGCIGRLEINKSLEPYNAKHNGKSVVKFKTELDAIRWKMDWLT